MTSINKILLLVFLSMGSVVMGFSQTHEPPFHGNPDTIIYTTEKQLEDYVSKVASAILANKYAQQQDNDTKEKVQLLKYQMLLSALGMNIGNNGCSTNNTNKDNYNDLLSRIENIENLCNRLLWEKENTIVPVRPINTKNGRNRKKPNTVIVSNAKNTTIADSIKNTLPKSIEDSIDNRIDNVLKMLERLEGQNKKLESKLKELGYNPTTDLLLSNLSPTDTITIETINVDTITVDRPVIDNYKRQVFFVLGRETLTKDAKNTLDNVVKMMNKYTDIYIDIIGYASSDGSKNNNLKLSAKRADIVYKYLINKGINKDRLFVLNGGIDTSGTIKATSRRVDILLHNEDCHKY